MKPHKLTIPSSVCVTSQLSLSLVMRIHDTGLAGKACGFLYIHSHCMCVHLNLTSNPLLAETFEIPELRFIAEKVSHNPVIMAYHAEGEGWELYATSSGKTKFWGTWGSLTEGDHSRHIHLPGKSLEIIPVGTTHVKIGNDHYQW